MARPAAELDPRIVRLASTTFCGHRLRRSQIADIQEVVTSLPLLSRTELDQTVCEYLRWQTPRGSNRIQLAMRLLEELERLSVLALPARQGPGRAMALSLVLRRIKLRRWCAVERRCFSAGAKPARQLSLQPVAVGAAHGGSAARLAAVLAGGSPADAILSLAS